MAKKPKQTSGIDDEKAKNYMARVENLLADIASERGTFMATCKSIREDITQVYSDAKVDGIPTKALKSMVKDREFDRKKAALKAGLDIDELSAFEQLQESLAGLGELPLGQAAMDAQRRRDAKEFDGERSEAAVEKEIEEKGIAGAAKKIGTAPATHSVAH